MVLVLAAPECPCVVGLAAAGLVVGGQVRRNGVSHLGTVQPAIGDAGVVGGRVCAVYRWGVGDALLEGEIPVVAGAAEAGLVVQGEVAVVGIGIAQQRTVEDASLQHRVPGIIIGTVESTLPKSGIPPCSTTTVEYPREPTVIVNQIPGKASHADTGIIISRVLSRRVEQSRTVQVATL